MYSSKGCVENRCVSTPAISGAACPGRRNVFYFSSLYVFSNLPVSGIQGQTEIFLSPKPQTFPSGVNSNHQRAASTHVCIRSVSPRPHEANEQIRRFIWREGKCKSDTTNEAHQIQNKQVDNSKPRPKPKITRVDFHHVQLRFISLSSDGAVLLYNDTAVKNECRLPLGLGVVIGGEYYSRIVFQSLTADTKTGTFVWILDKVKAAQGAAPDMFLQDADAAMTLAPDSVFPDAKKRRCMWHLGKNLLTNLRGLLGGTSM